MYTEMCIGVKLDTSNRDFIKSINYMTAVDNSNMEIDFNTDHDLFKTSRWGWMLRSGGSYYFESEPVLHYGSRDDFDKNLYLTFWTNIKNYDSEWELFLDYISPYIMKNHGDYFIGFKRYEQDDFPTIIYLDQERRVKYKYVND